MKKFLVIVAAIAALVAWSGTASAQCNTGGRFFGGNQCGSGHVFGGRVFHPAPVYSTPVYSSCNASFSGGCSSNGYVVVGQPQPQYTEGKKAVMPDPNYQPYKGGELLPAPAPKKTTQPEDLPLPPKKIQPPNPRQDGFPGSTGGTLQIDGESYGRLPNGNYAKISDGTYSRLMGNTAYGSYSK